MLKGFDAINASESKNVQLKLKNGESAVIRILSIEEVVSFYEHADNINGRWHYFACLGKGCPACEEGGYASYKCAVPVLDVKENVVKIFKMSRKTTKALKDFMKEYPDFMDRDIKVTRQGTSSDTVYLFYARDVKPMDVSEFELPDMEEATAKYSKEQIINLFNNTAEEPSEDESDDGFPF